MPTFAELLQAIDWKGCSKVFILLLILAVTFFIFWTLIKPDQSRKIGILPFPSSGPFVPLDASDCGRNIVQCTDTQGCGTACSSTKYQCTLVKGKQEVWYLGTKLESGKSFCLPEQAAPNPLQTCGTYTGKAVWNLNHWTCQCKYPSLFNGEDCLTQVSCIGDNGAALKCTSATCGKLVRTTPKPDGTKVVWDPLNMSADAEADNPLDWTDFAAGKPLYSCDCGDTAGSYTKRGDPYRCHSNLCYAGTSSEIISSNVSFNTDTNKCECDTKCKTAGNDLVQSNVTGFWYPVETAAAETNCQPDVMTGNCTCGNKFIQSGGLGMFFMRGSNIYVTYQIPNDPLCVQQGGTSNCPIYKVLIDGISGPGKEIYQTLATTLTDVTGAIVEFQLMQYPQLPIDINSSSFQDYVARSFPPFSNKINATAAMNMIVENANQSVVIPCDSYFYNRPHDVGCPPGGCVKCSDPYYESGDQNNKNGTMCYNPIANQKCGGNGSPGIAVFDSEGYYCNCDADDCVVKPQVSYSEEAIVNGHHVHECKKCNVCQGKTCSSDIDCQPCHKCNFPKGSTDASAKCCGC